MVHTSTTVTKLCQPVSVELIYYTLNSNIHTHVNDNFSLVILRPIKHGALTQFVYKLFPLFDQILVLHDKSFDVGGRFFEIL